MNESFWPVSLNLPVLWGDMDAFQHVNNTRYFRWFESARIEYFKHIHFSLALEEGSISIVLAHASCDYVLPVTYPDTVHIKASIRETRTSSMTQFYEIESEQQNKVVARGQSIIVMYDFAKKQKASIPENLKETLRKFEQNTEL